MGRPIRRLGLDETVNPFKKKKDKFSIGDLVEVKGQTWTKGRIGLVTGKCMKQHPVDGELMFFDVLFDNEVRATCFEINMTLFSGSRDPESRVFPETGNTEP